jgi:hypothetical protein
MNEENEYLIIGSKKYRVEDVQSVLDSRIKSYDLEEGDVL